MRPTPRSTPDEWARRNRIYKPSAGIPGPRDPSLTPYMVPFARAFDVAEQIATYGHRYDAVVQVTSSQTGKTDTVLDVIGSTLDQRPAPILYVGPNKEFLQKEIEPRLTEMLTGTKRLAEKLAGGKRNTKFRKLVGGVPIVLGWAGSASSLAAMAAKIALMDELDRMMASIQGEGDPFSLLEARGFSFRDRMRGAISTPLTGSVDTDVDPVTGLELWRRMGAEDVQSPIWRLWQGGTMHHFTWQCPHCREWFVPRFKQLKWPEGATAAEAKRQAYVECPRSGCIIEDHHKAEMNRTGRYVAPGQSIDADGNVTGEPPETTTLSFWNSGLCSPFVTFGERAASYVTAKASGEQEKLQAVMNTGFGECYSPGGGDVPEWEEVRARSLGYAKGTLPPWVKMLTLAVDVQMRSLYWTIRGWGAYGTSCVVDYGEILGATVERPVWDALGELLKRPIGDMVIRRAFVDSGFRPGKPVNLPMNVIYEFCRLYPRLAYASKGQQTQEKPVRFAKIEINALGAAKRYGLDLVHIDTDWAKSTVHEKVRKDPEQAGAWFVPDKVTEGFCKQIVSEARIRKPNGQPVWQRINRNNHYLDCEALQEAVGFSLNAHLIAADETGAVPKPQRSTVPVVRASASPSAGRPRPAPPTPSRPAAAPAPAATAAKPAPAAPAAVDRAAERRNRIAAAAARLYGG